MPLVSEEEAAAKLTSASPIDAESLLPLLPLLLLGPIKVEDALRFASPVPFCSLKNVDDDEEEGDDDDSAASATAFLLLQES